MLVGWEGLAMIAAFISVMVAALLLMLSRFFGF
ncbi:Uncharacterised protein [uncultured archaeon]|nr:Uncharacterised protein [uncultured archaeon]